MIFVLIKVPKLEVYVIHCANQVRAKSVLDDKRSSDRRVEDFLTRCLESPFSRRLDVWSYLGMVVFLKDFYTLVFPCF